MSALTILQGKINNPAILTSDLESAISETAQAIRLYCNLNDEDAIPVGLEYTHANMARDLVLYEYESKQTAGASGSAVDIADVASVKVGDTSVQIGAGGGSRAKALNSHRPNLDSIVMNYAAQLNKFRRLIW